MQRALGVIITGGESLCLEFFSFTVCQTSLDPRAHAGGECEGGSFIRNCRPTGQRSGGQCYVSYRKYLLKGQCRCTAQHGARHKDHEVTEILSAGRSFRGGQSAEKCTPYSRSAVVDSSIDNYCLYLSAIVDKLHPCPQVQTWSFTGLTGRFRLSPGIRCRPTK